MAQARRIESPIMSKSEDIAVVLGKRLRNLRKEKMLTQEEIAEKAGMNAKYYAQVERGQRNVTVGSLQRIADGLGVRLEDLFRFPHNRPLTDVDEELVSLVTGLILQGSKKSKMLARALLAELAK